VTQRFDIFTTPILRRIQVQLDWKTNVAAFALAQTEECTMTTIQDLGYPAVPELHVFEQAGNGAWGITVPRVRGCDFKLIAFSDRTFPVEDAARRDEHQVLAGLSYHGSHN
jgi:hypothetical protein